MKDPAVDPHDFTVEPFPRSRRLITDIGWMARSKHAMYGLLELDVTAPRQTIHQIAVNHGEKVSFTAFLAGCVGQAVAADPVVQAYRDWRGRLVIFKDVDVLVMVERHHNGENFPVGHILRGVQRRDLPSLHAEIREVQAQPMGDQESRQLEIFTGVPQFMRRMVLWYVLRSPKYTRQIMGTVAVTSVGMFGHRGGWGVAPLNHSLGITVGGITQKPGLSREEERTREFLNLTLGFDHTIVDGAPAARFSRRLSELIESGYGLAAFNDQT